VREGKLHAKKEPDLAAWLLMVLIAGLAHVDTLYPSPLTNREWRDLVLDIVAQLVGMEPPEGEQTASN
jgi:hypothetical protein